MIIKNTLVNGVALLASCAIPVGAVALVGATTPFFGGAAFTTALCLLGGLVGLPTLFGGLIGLLLLQILSYILVSILMHMTLAWIPV